MCMYRYMKISICFFILCLHHVLNRLQTTISLPYAEMLGDLMKDEVIDDPVYTSVRIGPAGHGAALLALSELA